MTDEVCKLRMDADCIVIDEVIYSFNYKFEDLLNMDKTMQKVKTKALEKILNLMHLKIKTSLNKWQGRIRHLELLLH